MTAPATRRQLDDAAVERVRGAFRSLVALLARGTRSLVYTSDLEDITRYGVPTTHVREV